MNWKMLLKILEDFEFDGFLFLRSETYVSAFWLFYVMIQYAWRMNLKLLTTCGTIFMLYKIHEYFIRIDVVLVKC